MGRVLKLSTDKCIYLVFAALLLCISAGAARPKGKPGAPAQKEAEKKDTGKKGVDSFAVPVSPSALGSEVKYKSRDSAVFDVDHKKVYLYGKAHMEYTDIKLDAGYIVIDYATNTIFAKGMPDSTGKMKDKPVFSQGKEVTNSDSMAYNFKSKKGKIYTLLMNEGEGFIHVQDAKVIKTDGHDVVYAHNGKYTTCNLPGEPHFYIESRKMKLIPNDKVVTGPAWIVIEGVPLPIILPFGFFPANSRKTTGIILPSYGESPTQGFALKGGGFYWGGNDHIDAALKGDIYTGGSYRLELTSRYKQIYKYNGDFDISYAQNQIGLKETPDFSVQENYSLHWSHAQDLKADPGTRFSASVNAATPGFSQKNDYTNIAALTNQTLSSSISYSKQFQNTPFNLSVSMTHDQNLGLKTVNFSLPNATLSMNRIYPFKNSSDPKKHWYDEIGFTYTANFVNHLASHDSTLKTDILDLSKYRSGIDEEIPISASFNVMKYFTLTPAINNSIYTYTKKFTDVYTTYYDPVTKRNRDTTYQNVYSGVYWAHTHSASLSLGTTVYGMYKFKKGRVLALRHVIIPSVSGVYSPDYSAPSFGYYGTYTADAYNTQRKYSYYTDLTGTSVLNAPPSGRQGSLNFGLQNNFEMKVKTKNDTVNATKKIKILDYFNFTGGYNFLADSMKLSPINMSTATTLFEKLSLQATGLFDPYYIDEHGQRHRYYEWDMAHKIGTLTSASLSAGMSLNSKSKNAKNTVQIPRNPFVYYNYPEQYASFDVPWDLRVNYIANYNGLSTVSKDGVYLLHPLLTHNVSMTGDLTPTKNWKIMVTSGYDLTTHQLTVTNIRVMRDLHCWAMSFEWSPFGTYHYYFFNIHIKASTLQDLKLEKRREYFDY